MDIPVDAKTECCKVGNKSYLFGSSEEDILFTFASEAGKFIYCLQNINWLFSVLCILNNNFKLFLLYLYSSNFISLYIFLDSRKFHGYIFKMRLGKEASVFNERTDDSSATQYFQVIFYFTYI